MYVKKKKSYQLDISYVIKILMFGPNYFLECRMKATHYFNMRIHTYKHNYVYHVHKPVRRVLACLSCGCSSLPGKWLQSEQNKTTHVTKMAANVV